MRNSFSKYLYVKQYLRKISIPFKELILPLVLSFILAILIFSGPISIIINLLVFVDYQFLLAGLLGFIFSLVLEVITINLKNPNTL